MFEQGSCLWDSSSLSPWSLSSPQASKETGHQAQEACRRRICGVDFSPASEVLSLVATEFSAGAGGAGFDTLESEAPPANSGPVESPHGRSGGEMSSSFGCALLFWETLPL